MVQFMPSVDDTNCDFHLEVQFGSGPSEGAHYESVL